MTQKSVYTPYKDTGLFGNYFYGGPECYKSALDSSNRIFNLYANDISDIEIERAKRKVFIELF